MARIEFDAEHIRLADLPMCCKAFLCEVDGEYYIVVNENYNYDIRNEAVVHELIHLAHGDLHNEDPVEICEERAQRKAKKIKAPQCGAERRERL